MKTFLIGLIFLFTVTGGITMAETPPKLVDVTPYMWDFPDYENISLNLSDAKITKAARDRTKPSITLTIDGKDYVFKQNPEFLNFIKQYVILGFTN